MYDRDAFEAELKHSLPRCVLETLARFCKDWGCEVVPPEELALRYYRGEIVTEDPWCDEIAGYWHGASWATDPSSGGYGWKSWKIGFLDVAENRPDGSKPRGFIAHGVYVPTGDGEMARFLAKNEKDNSGISCSFVSAE